MQTPPHGAARDRNLPGALSGVAWDILPEYASWIAERLHCRPLRSRVIAAVIPEGGILPNGGLSVPSRRGRVCRTGLVVAAHPEWYVNVNRDREPTRLKPGNLITYTRLASRELLYDSDSGTHLVVVRQEDVDAILNPREGDRGDVDQAVPRSWRRRQSRRW